MPWTSADTWIVITAALCAVACALPGCFLVLRGLSMMGDAISHAVLPGLAVGFLLTETRAGPAMLVGAAVVGVLTAVFTQWVARFGEVDRGAAMGIVFTTLFAIGLLILVRTADNVDLDPDCVLYGALEYAPLNTVTVGALEVPRAAVTLAWVLGLNLLVIVLLFKELRLAAFDEALADTLGFHSGLMHYLLMTVVAVTTVAAFEVVGSIIVIAMIIVPPATALLLTRRLVPALLLSAGLGVLASLLGHAGALVVPGWFGFRSTISSGMMATTAGLLFLFAWIFSPAEGLLVSWWRRRKGARRPGAGADVPVP